MILLISIRPLWWKVQTQLIQTQLIQTQLIQIQKIQPQLIQIQLIQTQIIQKQLIQTQFIQTKFKAQFKTQLMYQILSLSNCKPIFSNQIPMLLPIFANYSN